jgi:thioredoxin
VNDSQPKAVITEVDEASFEAEVLKSKLPVLVAFSAPWSRPCQILGAELEEIAATCAGRVKVVKVNADDAPDLGLWYEIQSIPTLLLFVDGAPGARIVGTASKKAILARLPLAAGDCDGTSTNPQSGKRQ